MVHGGCMVKLFDEVPHIAGERISLRRMCDGDAEALQELVSNDNVYRYLPTYLFERQYVDPHEAIRHLYEELFTHKMSLILGVCLNGEERICGLAEFYGLRDDVHKVSVGYRLLERYWGRGIATEVVGLMVGYLYGQTDIELITASTMVENAASARVLEQNDFIRTARGVPEDWGYEKPTIADKRFC